MRKSMLAVALVAAVLLHLAVPALAQAAEPTFTVDLTAIVTTVLTVLGSILTIVATWALRKVGTKFGVDADAAFGGILETAIHNGIAFARVRVLGVDGKLTVATRNEVLATTIQYVVDKVPGTMAHFGLTEKRLAELIKARLDPMLQMPDEAQPARPATLT